VAGSPQTLATGSVDRKKVYSENEPVLDHCEPVRNAQHGMAVFKLSSRYTMTTPTPVHNAPEFSSSLTGVLHLLAASQRSNFLGETLCQHQYL
jgi:hypothetical protein